MDLIVVVVVKAKAHYKHVYVRPQNIKGDSLSK